MEVPVMSQRGERRIVIIEPHMGAMAVYDNRYMTDDFPWIGTNNIEYTQANGVRFKDSQVISITEYDNLTKERNK
jgi:hypothetical protein